MDDENKENQTPVTLPMEDQKTLQDEGIEIIGRDDAPVTATPEVKAPDKVPKLSEIKREPENKQSFGTKSDDDIRPLRTYKSDVEEAIEHNRISAVKMAAAESERRSMLPLTKEASAHPGRGILFAAIGIVIVAIAVGGTAYVFSKKESLIPSAVVPSLPASLVDVTSSEKVPVISGENSMSDLEAKIQELKIQSGLLSQIVPVSENGIIIATSTDLFVALGINVPEQILQSLDGTFTLGAYASEENHPFLILGIKSFDNAFPGMLSWEKTMTTDLQDFIAIDHPNFTTGDTAPVFTDKIILNKDVREFDDASGTAQILYSFTDANTLVITTDETAMSQIITRLNDAKVVR